ncbi:MAG: hypothetical protein JSV26_10550 [bacterium]|nr:MAG: hypothetical protein JSV26_10550 [bacterium]
MIDVRRGWRGGREINTVTFDPDLITVEEMALILRQRGTLRGVAREP